MRFLFMQIHLYWLVSGRIASVIGADKSDDVFTSVLFPLFNEKNIFPVELSQEKSEYVANMKSAQT